MSQTKTLAELTIKNNFLFSAVMLDPENCRGLLEIILGIPIDRVIVSREQCLIYHPEYRSVRLDIYARDSRNTHYNVEMQVSPKPALTKRCRYYHSQMDMELLLAGTDYTGLPDTYVIFICDFDPFGRQRYIYTFENCCMEDGQIMLNEGCKTIFLSTRGTNRSEISAELAAFLEFAGADLAGSQGEFDSAYVRQLQTSIRNIKNSREMRERYMIFEELLKEERSEGKTEGRIEGRIEAMAEAILELLEVLGPVPGHLSSVICSETDLELLKKWHRLAARSTSVQQFINNM